VISRNLLYTCKYYVGCNEEIYRIFKIISVRENKLTRRSTVVNVPDFLDSNIALAFSTSSSCVFCAAGSVV
jgi:hypothetical protein